MVHHAMSPKAASSKKLKFVTIVFLGLLGRNMLPGVNSSNVTTRRHGFSTEHGCHWRAWAKARSISVESLTDMHTRELGFATSHMCSPPSSKGSLIVSLTSLNLSCCKFVIFCLLGLASNNVPKHPSAGLHLTCLFGS